MNSIIFDQDCLIIDNAGQEYLESLKIKLAEQLSSCQTTDETEELVKRLLPQTGVSAVIYANKSRTDTLKSRKSRHYSSISTNSISGALSNIKIFADKFSSLMKESGSKVENEVTKFKIAIIDYVIEDIINLVGRFIKSMGNHVITKSDIRTAMHAVEDLPELFLNNTSNLGQSPILQITSHRNQEHSNDYFSSIKSLINSETAYERDLKLIIKVFKNNLDVPLLFGNIDEILELTTSLLISLEDAIEGVVHQDEVPSVGLEICELAAAEEFQAYLTFSSTILSEEWRQSYLDTIANQNLRKKLLSIAPSFDVAVEHLLPTMLLNVISHFFEFYNNLKSLYGLSKNFEFREDEFYLRQAMSILYSCYIILEKWSSEKRENLDLIKKLDSKIITNLKLMLERKLDAELENERNLPLIMPSVEQYRFSEPDTPENIKFDESSLGSSNQLQIPKIRQATLLKLVERLTYHKHHIDIVITFLNTYRSFTTPSDLLALLIERFEIPEPTIYDVYPALAGINMLDITETHKTNYKSFLKKFRQSYQKPVKVRVINVIKNWVRSHYYDFEENPELLDRLNKFLAQTYDTHKMLRYLIEPITKTIEAKKNTSTYDRIYAPYKTPPILWHTVQAHEYDQFDILTLHPEEFARQLTLIEFDLFKAIKPCELINIGDQYSSSRHVNKSPNVSRMTSHFTLMSYWLRKCIVEAEDFDHRVALFLRIIEIMIFLDKMNNFTGLFSVGCAIESAPIKRLRHTQAILSKAKTHSSTISAYENLCKDHMKVLQERIKSLNPPCIPYVGPYQTKLLHAKEANKTFIEKSDNASPTLSYDDSHSSVSNSPATPISPMTPLPQITQMTRNNFFGGCNGIKSHTLNTRSPSNSSAVLQPKLINFSKQRLRDALVAEVSRFQNDPYCFEVQPQIRKYITSMKTSMIDFVTSLGVNYKDIDSMTKKLDDYLYKQSEKIEPRQSKAPLRVKTKLPDSWKSPAVKVKQ